MGRNCGFLGNGNASCRTCLLCVEVGCPVSCPSEGIDRQDDMQGNVVCAYDECVGFVSSFYFPQIGGSNSRGELLSKCGSFC